MQALEDKCKTNDDKIKSLSTRCDALYKKAVRHERDIQDALSSATTTTTEAQPKVTDPATTGEEDARLTSLVQTVELHGHYFEEIRDRILQQEDAGKKAPTSAESPPQFKDLEKCIAGAVAKEHKRSVDITKRQSKQWSKEVNVLSHQYLQNKERLTLVEEADKNLDLKLCESKRQTDATLADFKSSVDGQLVAHKEAVDAEIKRIVVSFQQNLVDFANELQVNRLDGMKPRIQQLQSQCEELEACLHEQATTQPDTTMAAEPARPITSVFHFAEFPALQSMMGAGTVNVQNVGEEDHSMGGAFEHTPSASGDQPMSDVSLVSHHTSGVQYEVSGRCDIVTGNTTAEQYQAGGHEPSLAVGVPSRHTLDDLYGAVDAEDVSMDLCSSRSSCDDFVMKSAAPDRGFESEASAAVAAPDVGNRDGDDNRAPAGDSQYTTDRSQDDKVVAPQPVHGTAGGEIHIPGLGTLPKTEIPQSRTPSPLAEDELVFDPRTLSGVGGQPSTDFVLHNRAPAPTPSLAHTTLSQHESKTVVRSPFSGIAIRIPPTPTVEPKALSEPKLLDQAAQALQPGDIAGSQSKTAAATTNPHPVTGLVRRQLPLPQRRPAKPAIPSPMSSSVPRASAPSPPLEAPFFNYSADYIDELRVHVIDEALESWLGETIGGESAPDIKRAITTGGKGKSLGCVGELAEQAWLTSQDVYYKAAVEQIFSAWFDNYVVQAVDDCGWDLLEGSLQEEEEKRRFLEAAVRAYMEKHSADSC